MSAIANPYGLRPIQSLSGAPYMGPFREIKMTTNSAAGIFTGQMILISSGQPVGAVATHTSSIATYIGVCVGVRYVTPGPAGSQPMWGTYLPAGAITAGYTDVWIRVVDDPRALFAIQADEAVARTKITGNVQLVGFTGSTVTGNINTAVDGSTVAATNTFGFRLVDFLNDDTYPDLVVMCNTGMHLYDVPLGQCA